MFEPLVEYFYEVEGQRFKGSQWDLNGQGMTEDEAKTLAAAHPPGSNVKVFYDPRIARESALVVGVGSGGRAIWIAWVVLLFSMALTWFRAIRTRAGNG